MGFGHRSTLHSYTPAWYHGLVGRESMNVLS
jgi:hypothetical protein